MTFFSPFGFMLLALALAIPFLSNKVRKNATLRRNVGIVLFLKQCVSFAHIIYGPLPTLNADPIAFNKFALHVGAEQIYGNKYAQWLRWVYDEFGGSHLVGCEINQIGFALALVFFVEILYMLELEDQAPKLVLLFGLLPSMMLNTAAVLREGLQIGGFLGVAFWLLQLYKTGPRPWGFVVGVISMVGLVLLHKGFAPYLLLVVPLGLLWATGSRPWMLVVTLTLAMATLPAVGPRILARLQEESNVVDNIVEGKGAQFVTKYTSRVGEGRSAFAVSLDAMSVGGLLRTGPVVALQYLFAPFPWQVRDPIDLYGLFESMGRLVLFLLAVRQILRASGSKRKELLFLFFMFLTMELIWAAGTANWGTAFRHRLVGWGLLLALAGPGLRGTKWLSSGEMAVQRRPSMREKRRKLLAKDKLDLDADERRRRRTGRNTRPAPR